MPFYAYNCYIHDTTSSNYFLKLQSSISKLACSAITNGIRFIDCFFSLDNFKQVVDKLANRTMECFNETLTDSQDYTKYNGTIEFLNRENKDSIEEKKLFYLAEKFHFIEQFLSQVSSYTSNIMISFKRSGILKDQADRMLSSCENIKIIYKPLFYTLETEDLTAGITYKRQIQTFDRTQFYITFSSEGVNDPRCVFNQLNENTSLSSTPLESTELLTSSVNPFVFLGLFIGSAAGVYVLAQHLYKNFSSTQTDHLTGDELTSGFPCLGECEEAYPQV